MVDVGRVTVCGELRSGRGRGESEGPHRDVPGLFAQPDERRLKGPLEQR